MFIKFGRSVRSGLGLRKTYFPLPKSAETGRGHSYIVTAALGERVTEMQASFFVKDHRSIAFQMLKMNAVSQGTCIEYDNQV